MSTYSNVVMRRGRHHRSRVLVFRTLVLLMSRRCTAFLSTDDGRNVRGEEDAFSVADSNIVALQILAAQANTLYSCTRSLTHESASLPYHLSNKSRFFAPQY
jgi:hypothetical protein